MRKFVIVILSAILSTILFSTCLVAEFVYQPRIEFLSLDDFYAFLNHKDKASLIEELKENASNAKDWAFTIKSSKGLVAAGDLLQEEGVFLPLVQDPLNQISVQAEFFEYSDSEDLSVRCMYDYERYSVQVLWEHEYSRNDVKQNGFTAGCVQLNYSHVDMEKPFKVYVENQPCEAYLSNDGKMVLAIYGEWLLSCYFRDKVPESLSFSVRGGSPKISDESPAPFPWVWVIVPAGAVLIAAAATTALVIRKKKKQ
ncbi:MAG: hypothetical protein J6M34_00215 [Clostridia bacterium]|nr:hypothetical protein [Clostridia bacterium]